jgi:hypothetical protein
VSGRGLANHASGVGHVGRFDHWVGLAGRGRPVTVQPIFYLVSSFYFQKMVQTSKMHIKWDKTLKM